MSVKKPFQSIDRFKKTALKHKKVSGLFFITACLLLNVESIAVANVITVDGVLKGDHAKHDQFFHQGMQAYIDSDYQKAYEFWKTAEAGNHSKAMFNLGRMWLLGQVPNSPTNEQQALVYFQKSANLGYKPAQNYIQGSQAQLNNAPQINSSSSANELDTSDVTTSKSVSANDLPQLENDWLEQYSDSAWVIQMFASQETDLLKQMIRDFSLKREARILTERVDSQIWYKLVYGNYANKQAALDAKQSLPERLRNEKPWVRSIASIKQNQKQ